MLKNIFTSIFKYPFKYLILFHLLKDYTDFELANDDDEIMKFLKLEEGPLKAETLSSSANGITQNGINHNDKVSKYKYMVKSYLVSSFNFPHHPFFRHYFKLAEAVNSHFCKSYT